MTDKKTKPQYVMTIK